MKSIYILSLFLLLLLRHSDAAGQSPAATPPARWSLADKTSIDEDWMVKFLADGPEIIKDGAGVDFEARWNKLKRANLDGIDFSDLVVKAAKTSGAPEDTILKYLSFEGTSLRRANLEGLTITRCDFTRADFTDVAKLSGTYWIWTTMVAAKLANAELNGAKFDTVNANWADFTQARLSGAYFYGASKLNSAWFWGAVAPQSTFYFFGAEDSVAKDVGARDAHFTKADLSGARFVDIILTGSQFDKAELKDLRWDASGLPNVGSFSAAKGLESLRFENSEAGLVELRTGLIAAGLRDAERKINYSIQHIRTDRLWALGENGNGPTVWNRIEVCFRKVCFDWPCLYGMHPGRALRILGILCALCAIPYALIMFRQPLIITTSTGVSAPDTSRSGIWAVPLEKRIASTPSGPELVHVSLPAGHLARALPRAMWRAAWIGLFFSVISAFSTGYKDLDVGRWIERIKPEESTLRPTGWVRTLSGIQSLISFCLLILWLLTYFGRPFE